MKLRHLYVLTAVSIPVHWVWMVATVLCSNESTFAKSTLIICLMMLVPYAYDLMRFCWRKARRTRVSGHWIASKNAQAEDRCRRAGQPVKIVEVCYERD